MKEKDYVKIYRAKDMKQLQDEKKQIALLQESGRMPTRYHFPLNLQFELTTHCNVHCKHCYNNSGADNRAKDRMGVEQWKNFAQYLVSRGGIFQCVISGGEPLLLGDSLFEIMDILHDDGTTFLVISNGFLLTAEKARRFAKYRYKWFQVSIDGATAAWHDSFRQREGSWERATNGAYLISKEGIPLTIAHTVTPGNLSQVEEMCALAYSLGAGSIILGEVNPSGRSANSLELKLNHEQENILYRKIEEMFSLYSGRMVVQRSSNTRTQLLRYRETPNTGAIVRPNGDIRLDCMAPFVLGNVLDDDFATVWEAKAADCWQNPRISEYIQGFSEESDINDSYKNYYDADIRL